MTKNQILRCIAFLLIVCFMLLMLCVLFEKTHGWTADVSFHTYRKLEEDTVDAVFIGTSGVSCYWIAPLAYEEYGMTVYPLVSDAMPSWLYPNVIDEALTYQNPDLIILDIRPFTSVAGDTGSMDIFARNVLDAMKPFSGNHIRTAIKTMEMVHTYDEDAPRWDISYLLNFVKYHSRWNEDGFTFTHQFDLSVHQSQYGGFFLYPSLSGKAVELPPHLYDRTVMEDLLPLHETALYDVLDYIKEKDLNVLFVDTPKVITDTAAMGRINRVYQILEEEGYECITFLTTAEDGSFSIDLDYASDFFNANHVNYYGAEKFTRAFSAYLNQTYDLPDRRTDPSAAAQWDGLYDNILTTMDDIEAAIAAGEQTTSHEMLSGD